MGKIYLKTDYDKCDYITAGKLYEARPFQTVKDDGVNYDAYHIDADNGMEIYAYVDGKIPHLHNEGHFYLVESSASASYVRPAMTPEARDILNSIHETVGAETRSDSIVEFMGKHTEMEVELCSAKLRWSRELNRANNNDRLLTESRKQEAKLRCQNVLLKKKAQEYKVFTCVSILTAVAALVALTLGVK